MLFLVPFFTWFSLREAVRNDQRTAEGKPLIEQEETAEKVLTWPDLVYTELICMVLLTVILIGWSMALAGAARRACKSIQFAQSLEGALVLPRTPGNAGVLRSVAGGRRFPGPDHRRIDGNSIHRYQSQRKRLLHAEGTASWEITTFLFGFLILWILLVILGTFLRGPNWNFFGPYEFWDIHKLEALVNVNLSEYIWVKGLGTWVTEEPAHSRDVRFHRGAGILPVDSATAGEEMVQRLLHRRWARSDFT